jgi:hypothetical protein
MIPRLVMIIFCLHSAIWIILSYGISSLFTIDNRNIYSVLVGVNRFISCSSLICVYILYTFNLFTGGKK